MYTLVEYFVRHYSLVLDNDQYTHSAVQEAIQEITKSSDVTAAQYRAMSATDRATEFASSIGEKVLELIGEWYNEAIEGREDSVGGLLIREIMIDNGSEIGWELGKNYLPEDSDADEFFNEDADDE
jgi:hypothetical protein